jgi:hypothetical protein
MQTTLGDATEREAVVIGSAYTSNLEAARYRTITRHRIAMEIPRRTRW